MIAAQGRGQFGSRNETNMHFAQDQYPVPEEAFTATQLAVILIPARVGVQAKNCWILR